MKRERQIQREINRLAARKAEIFNTNYDRISEKSAYDLDAEYNELCAKISALKWVLN
jgi:hypothetical protein